jgi:hypothetical protein
VMVMVMVMVIVMVRSPFGTSAPGASGGQCKGGGKTL